MIVFLRHPLIIISGIITILIGILMFTLSNPQPQIILDGPQDLEHIIFQPNTTSMALVNPWETRILDIDHDDLGKGFIEGQSAFQWNVDGTQYASTDENHTVALYNSSNDSIIHQFRPESTRVTDIVWIPDNELLAVLSVQGQLTVWNLKSYDVVFTKTLGSSLRDYIVWDATSSRLVYTDNIYIDIWDRRLNRIQRLGELHEEVSSLAWSNDNRILALGTYQNIHLWWIDQNTVIRNQQFPGHTDMVTALHFTLSGMYLISGSGSNSSDRSPFDTTVRIWAVDSLKCIVTLKGHKTTISALAITSDGTRLVSGSNDGHIQIWDLLSLID